MAKFDPYKNKEKYENWKEKIKGRIPDISKENSDTILQYLEDMERGVNIAKGSKKGSRSYIRLNTMRRRIKFLAKKFEAHLSCSLTKISEEQLLGLFQELRSGKIRKANGEPYGDVKNIAKDFKAFWHWHQKRSKKQGEIIEDISTDLDTTGEKPKWVYLTEEQVKSLADSAKYNYKILIWFLYDTGIRAPTELMNIRVSDFFNDFKELQIREEVSKTFGRRIKLMICSDLIKEYVQQKRLGQEDYLFTNSPASMNTYLKRLCKRVLDEEKSPAGEYYHKISLYDFRHCSCCYWLPRYKSESALKYRFGWKKSEKIHYYSELLGMRDTINEEDLLVDVTKVELEKRLDKTENKVEILQEENLILKDQIKRIALHVQQLVPKVKLVCGEDGGLKTPM